MSASPPGNYISQIVVEELYGEFTYQIGPLRETADPRVIVLYGDNGTGKTTILQLLRSLLSPSNTAGHRSRIAKVPFKKFEVTFRDGTAISASREKEIIGSYLLSISGSGDSALRIYVKADVDMDVSSSTWSRQDQLQFQSVLQRLGQVSSEVGFLDDRRTFTRSELGDKARMHARRNVISHEGLWVAPVMNEAGDPVAASLTAMVESVRREALMRQRRGTGDSQSIYKNLIKTLARGGTPALPTLDGLRNRLKVTEKLSRELSNIGLTSPLQHLDMIQQIESASEERRMVVSDLVSAYVESTEAWFSALTELKALLDKFVDRLNFFMHPKRVSFSVNEGLMFCSREGKPLSVGMLSSGERHLVMMLSQALLRRNDASVLVIDEPELSLNMKWQRELVGSILDCLGGGASQVVMATHSIEIAARYRGNVVRLWASGGDSSGETND
jgi:predicted ATPase